MLRSSTADIRLEAPGVRHLSTYLCGPGRTTMVCPSGEGSGGSGCFTVPNDLAWALHEVFKRDEPANAGLTLDGEVQTQCQRRDELHSTARARRESSGSETGIWRRRRGQR